jgi:hypothetical protein
LLGLGLPIDALVGETVVIDAGLMPPAREKSVDRDSPGFPPAFQFLDLIPVPSLGTEPRPDKRAQGEENVGMVVAIIPPMIGGMDRDIGDHATSDKHLAHEFSDEFDAFFMRQLEGQAQDEITRELSVFPTLTQFDCVPQPSTVAHPIGCAGRRDDLGMQDAALA